MNNKDAIKQFDEKNEIEKILYYTNSLCNSTTEKDAFKQYFFITVAASTLLCLSVDRINNLKTTNKDEQERKNEHNR